MKIEKGSKIWIRFGFNNYEALITDVIGNKKLVGYKISLSGGRINFFSKIFWSLKKTETLKSFEERII